MKPATELAEETMGTAEYLKACLKDPGVYQALEKQSLYRARRVALILGGIFMITLIMVVFAFVQDVQFKVVVKKKSDLETQLNFCVQEVQKQQGLATESMLILSEANKLVEEQLRACLSKK
jgi:hypothetical protein